jgi:hypothetical protein
MSSSRNSRFCRLGPRGTLAAKTPPASCTLYLSDGEETCSTWVRFCSPGLRFVDESFPPEDPRVPIAVSLQNRIADLEGQLAGVASNPMFDLTPYIRVEVDAIGLLEGPHVVLEGANLHIRSGSGSTGDGGEPVGLGNLIVGYNAPPGICRFEPDPFGMPRILQECSSDAACGGEPGSCEFFQQTRTGSHNIVVGNEHTYTSTGGFVVGRRNKITGRSASVSGGIKNSASGTGASVAGGWGNSASGYTASVAGGGINSASGLSATVAGGTVNRASGYKASILGGAFNRAEGAFSTVGGGGHNAATNISDAVAGGHGNIAQGGHSAICGGGDNTASGIDSVVLGGRDNEAFDRYEIAP